MEDAAAQPEISRLGVAVPLNTQHIADSLRCLFLGGGGDMGVGVQGETCGEMSQHSADGLDVHAVLQSYRSERFCRGFLL